MPVHFNCPPGHASLKPLEHSHVCSHTSAHSSVHQSLDELEFERGIWSAALEGDIERVRKLLATTAADATDTAGYTALHYAARAGHYDVCQLLLNYGVSVDCRTRAGQATPLHRAATAGKLNICQLLVQNGANPQAVDSDGKTAVARAREAGRDEVTTFLTGLRTE